MNGVDKPFAAYSGSEPYVFVCYAHKDAPTVYADLVELDGNGVHVWYDEGIPAGSAWRGEIAAAIKGASKLIFYISEASLVSSHCLREVDYALHHDLEIVPVYLEDCPLPEELELVLNRVQALFRNKDDRFMGHLLGALSGKRGLVPLRSSRKKPRLGLTTVLLLLVVVLAPLLWMQWDRSAGRQPDSSPVSSEPSAYDHYLDGLKLVERWDKGDNLEQAIGLFREAATMDPDFALAYARLAEALRLRYAITRDDSWLSEAAEDARKAVQLSPDLAPVQVALGQVHSAQGNIDLASAAFERALAIDPNDAPANQAMAKVYERQGRVDDAEASLQKALALAPDNLLIRDSYANFLYRQGRFDEAADQWRSVIRQAPDHFGALVNLGSALSEMGKLPEAITMYERAIEIRPNYMAYVNLGTAYARMDNYPKAVEALNNAIKLDDSDWLAWGNLAYAYSWKGGEEAKARETFEHAIGLAEAARKENPRDPFVNSDLALYYAKTGQEGLALERLQTALTLSPDSGEILAAAAEVYENAGQHDKAVEAALKSMQLGFQRLRLQLNPELAGVFKDPRLHDLP
ncbi:MAG: tetratricopeptide repeat protein [Lysobacterales bacterium]|jgi:tetratricopeptide (TPR) repeat protein